MNVLSIMLNRRGPARVATVMAVLLLGACGAEKTKTPAAHTAGTRPPRRVVCGSPAVAEIVFALGCGDRVVGVSDYTAYPPEACAKPSVGGLLNPNRERLLGLSPDMLVTQGRHEALAAFARTYGIRFQSVTLDTLADLDSAIRAIAETLGVAGQGRALADGLRGELTAGGRTAPPRRVLLLLGRAPGVWTGLSTVGNGTFLGELLGLAGGTNVFADATGPYPHISKEALLVRQPEVILEVHPGGLTAGQQARLCADWHIFADLPAVRQRRVHVLTNDFLLIPGPRVRQTARILTAAIGGEARSE